MSSDNQPTYFFFDYETWGVSPAKDRPSQFASEMTANDDEGAEKHLGDDEFESLITHLPEMGLQRVSWKHYAKTQQLLVKQFSDFKSADTQFDFNLMTGDTEQRLVMSNITARRSSASPRPESGRTGNT